MSHLLRNMRALFFFVTGLGVAGGVCAQNFGTSLSVLPTAPIAFDMIVARLTMNQTCIVDPDTLKIRQSPESPGTIRVDIKSIPGCIPTSGPVEVDVMLGQFPPGLYSVSVNASNTLLATGQFQVADSTETQLGHHPLVDYTDLWWTVQESGWGLTITQHTSGRIFAAWYVYDQAKQPVWYTLQPGQWTTYNTYTGPVYKTTGPYFGGPFDQTKVSITQVGTATLTFGDYATGVFSYAVEGVTGTKVITRLPY